MSAKALVVLSGGQDSTTCLFWAKQHFKEIHAVTFDYGQKHRIEIEAALNIANRAGVASHEVVSLLGIRDNWSKDGATLAFAPLGENFHDWNNELLLGASPLTNKGEKLEQYKRWQDLPGGLEKTFVPGRNILFLTLAANRAYALGCLNIITGICQEDSGGYPDCRETFRQSMEQALIAGLDLDIRILTPLMHLTKAQSVKLAYDLPGCWDALAYSHTSYDGQYPPTGHDHATLLRAKGFEQADLPDPLIVRAWREGLMPLPETANYYATRRAAEDK